ncbi:hypothetical protein SSP24_38930 [Streptomyces spinoverrucosus]|uniref:Uncharacterized protein n=1 Tax=Streptomyces spinoverrucosus TaxID=284043 RepID=A0A4Y3VJB6_9ACTN|nr:hypothetical protein SSP24_38930 [Streptomyces spinoverrucosus]GHB75622.1 hypothetical protein GCM10010397_52500 [Streptomyces spinoverrucosus]
MVGDGAVGLCGVIAGRNWAPSGSSRYIGADSVLECVGTREAMRQALYSTRPGGNVGFDGQELFYSHVGLRGGPAPVRAYLWTRSPRATRQWTNAAPSRAS